MRIVMTDRYAYERNHSCDLLDDCERHYCPQHRILFKDCDTAQKGVDDYHLDGRPHYVWELGGCPSCEAEVKAREYERRYGITR